MKVSRPKKPKKERLVRELSPEERRQRHWQLMLTVVQIWTTQEASSYLTSSCLSCLRPASSYTSTDTH